ncbi:MAG TPA: hypothetical protein VKX39_12550 [Bryobacteraceae bacterium]|jgi:bifunctional ADP-heptose synthase (sugar kinase/adenylyltransferase)|nr:hypothetical protein [Bryobacteraceae bacterium]
MDTRTKIVGAEEAVRLAAAGAVVVSGYFDPLLSEHAERLARVKQGRAKLLVAIASPPDPLLPARARAEMVAGLRVVDYVTEANIASQICFEQEDAACFERLARHVRARQRSAAAS